MNGPQRTDFYVGLFLVATVAIVVAAFVVTGRLWSDDYDLYVRTNNAQAITVDTRIYLQGVEVGRVAGINPVQDTTTGQVEFVIRASITRRFADGSEVRLPRGTEAILETQLLGGSTLLLRVPPDTAIATAIREGERGWLRENDTLVLERSTPAMEAFGSLAQDLRGTIQQAIEAATITLRSTARLADSLTVATGSARQFLVGIRPGTEKVLAGVASNLDLVQVLLDSTTTRTGVTFRQVNATIEQTRRLLVSADSLTRLIVAMGGENRPEMRGILINIRQLTEQLQYVMEQLGRRPMRIITGVNIPDSLSVIGRDTSRRRAGSSQPRDTSRTPERQP
ncbi:MAG TPA: MlaD family protein [Gemmatimonadales bacterium]|nr:MlaD family protein [Gemmatimonadales bacterium]